MNCLFNIGGNGSIEVNHLLAAVGDKYDIMPENEAEALFNPYKEVLRAMPPKELATMQEAYYDLKDMHLTKAEREADIQPIRTEPKYGRNETCPCKSGKKYKKCCKANGC